jgi:hypothetical protein
MAEVDDTQLVPDEMWGVIMEVGTSQEDGLACVMMCMTCKQLARVFRHYRRRCDYFEFWPLHFVAELLRKSGTPSQVQWFMDECGITRDVVWNRYHIDIPTALLFGNLVLADWLWSQKIGPLPTLEEDSTPGNRDWFFRHGAIVLETDSRQDVKAYRNYHGKRIGLFSPKQLQLELVPVQFDTRTEWHDYMRQHLRRAWAPSRLSTIILQYVPFRGGTLF